MSNSDVNCVKLKLSLHPDEEALVSDIKKMMLEEELEEFDGIRENDVNIRTSYVFDDGENIEIGVFFRNATKDDLHFTTLPLTLVDENENILVSETFRLDSLGEVPAYSARPHKILFSKANMPENININKGCKIIFSEQIETLNIAHIEYEDIENIPFEMQMFLKQSLNTLPPIEKGQVDLTTYEVYMEKDNKIKVTFLVRNGKNETFKVEKLPITIYDKNNKIIHTTTLEIDGIELNSNKAKLFSFIIDCSNKELSEFDLSMLNLEFKR